MLVNPHIPQRRGLEIECLGLCARIRRRIEDYTIENLETEESEADEEGIIDGD